MIINNFFACVIVLSLSFFANAKTCELEKTSTINGMFTNNVEFNGKYTYCRFNELDEDNASQIVFEIYINGVKNTYVYAATGYPSVDFSQLGIISIYDKSGGMQSPATVVYLTSQNNKLIEIGKIKLIYDAGLVSNYIIESIHDDTDYINSMLLKIRQDFYISKQSISYEDAFLLLLSDKILKDKVDAIWIRNFYSKLRTISGYDIINLYNQNIFFKDKTLCQNDEKNVFGCEIKNHQLSICYQPDLKVLKYKFGNISNIDLELARVITDKDSEIMAFRNTNTDYIVNTQEGQEGILVKQNNEVINDLKCKSNSIQPMILQGFY